jgi:hypothetical protein
MVQNHGSGTAMEVGGRGHVVEIDETSIKKKSKYNRGTVHEDCWLFGGVDRSTNLWFGIIVYNNRQRPVLCSYIKKHVKRGTCCYQICIDVWLTIFCARHFDNERQVCFVCVCMYRSS